jgi:branched-chain amino acid aminotransferase
MTLAHDIGIPVQESVITRDQLYIADEVFITGTAAEVVPVRMVDYRNVGQGKPGSITKSLMRIFSSTVHGLDSHSTEWLDYLEKTEAIIGRAQSKN